MAVHMRLAAGIAGCSDDAASPEFYRFNSRWDGIVHGQRVTVFAGSLRADPARGVLLVKAMPKDGNRRGRHFDGPKGSGSLTLVGWAGGRLKLLAENGDSVWFEVPVNGKERTLPHAG